MNLNRKPHMMGDNGTTYVKVARPESRVQVHDASGKLISEGQDQPAIIHHVTIPPESAATGQAGMGGVLPILLVVGAAWLLTKG